VKVTNETAGNWSGMEKFRVSHGGGNRKNMGVGERRNARGDVCDMHCKTTARGKGMGSTWSNEKGRGDKNDRTRTRMGDPLDRARLSPDCCYRVRNPVNGRGKRDFLYRSDVSAMQVRGQRVVQKGSNGEKCRNEKHSWRRTNKVQRQS